MDTVGVTSNVRLSNEEKALADKLSAFAYGEYLWRPTVIDGADRGSHSPRAVPLDRQ